jgi:putative peptidoglycan lipid II flippase
VAFIPVLTEHLHKDQREKAWEVTSSLLNIMVLATIAGGVFILVFAGPLTTLVSPGFDASTHATTVTLTRIMAITPVLFAISSILGSVQQAFNRFMIFSLAGVLYNLGIIIGIVAFADHFGIYGAAWGVVVGVIAQALFQWLGLYGLGFKYKPVINFRLAGVGQTLRLMLPRSIDQGIDQINYSVETIIGSTINAGAIGQFALANNLKMYPWLSSAALSPRLSSLALPPKLPVDSGNI